MTPRPTGPARPLLLTLLLLATGCFASAGPRFSPEVAAAIADRPMRRLETPDLTVYYPEARGAEARRFAGWVGGCVRDLRRWLPLDNVMSRRKPFIIVPEQPLNNAFVVAPAGGYEIASVVTSHSTFDFLVELGMPPDPALFGCHEMVHWVHMMQIGGFFGLIDLVFGDVITPQIGLDPWFHEGLATLYETRLQGGIGRIASPYWEGAFAAGMAGHRVNGGDLSFAQRQFTFSNHYLVGSRFLAFLLERYGEQRLWEVVRKQGTSFFFPLWVDLRFWQVYDKTLSTLIDEFADEVERRYPVIARPPQQTTLRPLGHTARYATARNGAEATISEDFDRPIRLEVRAPDGRLVQRRALRELLLPRKLVEPATSAVSGLSLTADGAHVYFSLIDQDVTFMQVRLVHYDVAADRLEVVAHDLGGPGGAITDDGRAYLYARARGDRHELCELQLASGQSRTLASEAGVFYGSPRPSPDGQRLVATQAIGNVTRVVVLDRATGRPRGAALPSHGNAVDPWFVDDHRVLYVDKVADRFQLFVADDAAATQLSRAPYLALGPRPAPGGRVRFLNREGWGWTLDELPLDERPAVPAATPVAPTGDQTRAPAPTPTPPLAPVVVESDEPYRIVDSFFFPQLRGVTFTGFSGGGSAAGVTLAGGDHLGFHRWAAAGYLDTSHPDDALKPSVSLGYANSQLAPLTLQLAGRYFSWWGSRELWPDSSPEPRPAVARDERELALGVSRPFYTHAVAASVHASDERRYGDPDVPSRRRLGGASASLLLTATETTSYTGVRRGLALALDASLYPDGVTSERFTFADLRGELDGRFIVPPTRRLSLGLGLRGRTIAGSPADRDLLELGGVGALGVVYRHSNRPIPPEPDAAFDILPVRFVEPLRGYEDLTLPIDRVAIADAHLLYPLIIDRGFASTLWLLPSLFVRQVELEAWGTAAWDRHGAGDSALHAAAGGAVSLRMVFWLVPLSLQYQVGKRLRDDRALIHLFGIGN